jgi:hypothetical protein
MNIDIIHNTALMYIEEKLKPIVESIGEPLEGNIFEEDPNVVNIFLPKRKNIILACQNKRKALEIGFNSGYSALLLLLSNPHIHLTCVDIAWHRYTIPCYQQIKKDFGNRIQLLVGDSKVVVPTIIDKFDLIHIDGGHTLDIANSDIINTNKLLMNDAVIIMDDVNINDSNHGLSNLWVQLSTLFDYKAPSFEIYKNNHQDIRIFSTQ